MEKLKELVPVLVGIVLFIMLWPLIKWVALAILVAVIIFAIKVHFDAKKIESQLHNDPNAFVDENPSIHSDVIDVEYKEKEIEEVQ